MSQLLVIGEGVERRTLYVLMKRLLEFGVGMEPITRVTSIDSEGVSTEHVLTNAPGRIDAVDAVVCASGGSADDDLARHSVGRIPEIYSIGDALAPRRLLHAVLEGARVSRLV